MKKIFGITFSISILLVIACSKTNSSSTTTNCSGTQSFTTDVSPIFQSSCAISGCHASGSSNGPGALITYQQIYNNRTAIRTAVANGIMPQSGSLSTTQKNTLLCWIDNGAISN